MTSSLRLQNISPDPPKNQRNEQIYQQKPSQRVYQTLKITHGIPLLFRRQKGFCGKYQIMTLPGLPKTEHRNYQEHVPLTFNLGTVGQAERSQVFY